MCYWNTDEMKEGKLKYNKERKRKTSQIMQLNREIKNTNKIKLVKIMKR